MGAVDDLVEAREAYERREWVAAYRALTDLDAADLRADDFAALATTAYLLGRHNDCVQALQRAFQANADAGNEVAAARSALWLALVLSLDGEPAVGGGWAARATRILDGIDADVVERGYAMIHDTYRCVFSGDLPGALERSAVVVEYGERFGEPDLLAQGLNMKGRLLTHAGQVQEGLRLIDESLVGVVSGEVSPIFSGIIYCTAIEACAWVCDYGRMSEWTRALTSWCDTQPGLVAFTGQCAVHRGQLMRFHGAFRDATEELERAAERYALAGGSPAVGLAHEERGDVLLILGDIDGAERAYEQAVEHGSRVQPGRALLQLAKGDAASAATAIRAVLDEVGDPVERNRLLPAAVDILVAAREIDEATRLADELGRIAETFGCAALRAAAGRAAGVVALASDDPSTAVTAVRPAIDRWTELRSPYEVARCRFVLGSALRALGDEQSAISELRAARDTFDRLGAIPAAHDATRSLVPDEVPGGLSPREVEVLRLVAAGKSNADIAAELVVADKTVARHLSNIFTKLGVASRTAAAAFAFQHDLV
jgi:DNA-binding NarL/FixJ family response regulator